MRALPLVLRHCHSDVTKRTLSLLCKIITCILCDSDRTRAPSSSAASWSAPRVFDNCFLITKWWSWAHPELLTLELQAKLLWSECSASPHTGAVIDRPAWASLQASVSGCLSGSCFGLGGFRDPLSLLLELRQVLHRQTLTCEGCHEC